MRQINLQEHQESKWEPLTPDERDLLSDVLPSVSIEPVRGAGNKYRLRPGSIVGALEIGDMSVLIKPKIGIPQLLSLACYAMGVYKPEELKLFDFQRAITLPDVLALALIAAARRAFGRGLLRGYLSEEDTLFTVRGRVRFDEQIRRRYGIPLPVELGFDEFTEDILANRLVKAAAARLGGMTLRSPEARRGLGWIAAILENVTWVEFRRSVPRVRFDKAERTLPTCRGTGAAYSPLHSEFESKRGYVRANGFLIDMNILFQEFVTEALRESLGVPANTLRSEVTVSLDYRDLVPIRPDLSWWESGVCKFVGDAKYKNITGRSVPNVDLYQLLAYSTALNLPGGLLIYAKGEAKTNSYRVLNAGKWLEVAEVDLSEPFTEIRKRIDQIGRKIMELKSEACWFHLEQAA